MSIKASVMGEAVAREANAAIESVKRAADDRGITEALERRVVEPARKMGRAISESEALKSGMATAENAYGATRNAVKDVVNPYFATNDARALLLDTKRELDYVSACVMQISPAESSAIGAQFSRALASKVTGTAAVSGLLALVGTFGAAGTGTPIATLAGAAAAKATLAWVGSLVGGGVAAGTALTGGVAFVVGLAAYKALGSDRRDFEGLSESEQRLMQTCWLLGMLCGELAESSGFVPRERMKDLFEDALLPLYKTLRTDVDALCEPLDGRHAVAFRQHLLHYFGEGVITRFGQHLGWRYSPEGEAWEASVLAEVAAHSLPGPKDDPAASEPSEGPQTYSWPEGLLDGNLAAGIGGAFAAMLTRQALDDSKESVLFMQALRRALPELCDASDDDVTARIREVAERSEMSLPGLANNVKGIFHEFLWVDRYSAAGQTTAHMYESTSHPGADVKIVDPTTGQVVSEYQLKAASSSDAVHHHLERYPGIPVAVTDEVAADFNDDRVVASGFSNAELSQTTDGNLGALHDHTLAHRAGDTAMTAALVGSAAEVMQMLRGERAFPDAVLNVAAKTGVAVGATAMTVLLFG